jgi:SHS2 domain-containing protein
MAKFEYFEHTADIGIKGYGAKFEEALENVANGMFTYICDISKMETNRERRFEINTFSREEVVIRFLSHLILLFDKELFVPVKYEIIPFSEKSLQVHLWGDFLDPSTTEVHAEIKAATYHQLKVEENKGWMIQVIFDV